MPSSAKISRTLSTENKGHDTPVAYLHLQNRSVLNLDKQQRRARHITSIQIRNLTPFPVRDEAASALVQPSPQPQFGVYGHLSDDLDVTLGSRRPRRRSSTSLSYIDPEESRGSAESLGRKRALSRASNATTSSVGRGGTSQTRPAMRSRTISTSSLGSFSEHAAAPITARSLSGFLQDTSQSALEHVIQSRLVETFITISIPPSVSSNDTTILESPSSGRTANVRGVSKTLSRRSTITNSASHGSLRPKTPTSPPSTAGSSSGSRFSTLSSHTRAASVSVLSNGRTTGRPSAPKAVSHKTPPARPTTSPKISATPTTQAQLPTHSPDLSLEPVVPDFMSPIHRPSTNPYFELDPQGGFEFAPDTDLRSSRIIVELWGRPHSQVKKGKGKERADTAGILTKEREWRVLQVWDFDLNDLSPLPAEVCLREEHCLYAH